MCHSDYHRIDGHSAIGNSPFVMGHEGAGIVQQVGPGVTDLVPGDLVIFGLARTCRLCRNCSVGLPSLCEGRTRGGGTMADGTTRFSKDGVPYYHGLAPFAEETVVLADSVV